MKLRPPPVDVGTLTVGTMAFGILFGWGVLYLTRDETREGLANLHKRVRLLENADEELAAREAVRRLSLARAAYLRGAPTKEDTRILREAGELDDDQADEGKEDG